MPLIPEQIDASQAPVDVRRRLKACVADGWRIVFWFHEKKSGANWTSESWGIVYEREN